MLAGGFFIIAPKTTYFVATRQSSNAMFGGGSAQPPARKQKMHALNNFKRSIWLGLLTTTGMGISPTLGNTELSKTYDCNTIELEAVIDQNASREDNLERLSQQFFQSVNRIEHCDREPQTDNDQPSSSNAADADDSADADASADASADAPAQPTASPGGASTSPTAAQATPSSSLVGTSLAEDLPNMVAPSASNMAGTTPMADPADMGTATSTMTGTETGTMTGTATDAESETAAVTARPQMQQAEPDQRLTNGKIPDDIPDADNDSVFEAQIRAAAMAETDPDTQKNLWNEYRRYKGLPEQE